MKGSIILLLCLLNMSITSAQKKLSLTDVIKEAKKNSIQSKQIENRFQNSYWRNFSYKRQFRPALFFDGTIPSIERSIVSVTQPNGSEIFTNRNVLSNSARLSINQELPFTGGNLFVRSGLQNIVLSGNSESTTFLTQPIEIGYSQNLFGFNQYKWDKKIEPLYFSESELLKTEEIEELSIESVNRYFDLLRAQLSMENAEKNLLNNDTIYKIGKGRYKYGKIAENELLQLELSLLNAELAFEQEKVNYEINKQQLATFLGYSSQKELTVIIDTTTPPLEVDYKHAFELANEYNSIPIQQDRKIFESEMKVARVKSNNRLTINLVGSFGLTQTSDNITDAYKNPQAQEFVSLGIQAPIIQWGLSKGRIKQAEINAELVRSTVDQEKINFEQTIYAIVAQFNLNKKQLEVSKRAKEVAQKRFMVSKRRYLIGKIIITDLQIAQREKDNALVKYVNAYRAYWQSYYEIRKITHYDFLAKTKID